jgi:hypothetical protein
MDRKGVLGMGLSGIFAFVLVFFLMIVFVLVSYFMASLKNADNYVPQGEIMNERIDSLLFESIEINVKIKEGEYKKQKVNIYEGFVYLRQGKILEGDLREALKKLLGEGDCLIIAQGLANLKIFADNIDSGSGESDYFSLRMINGEVEDNKAGYIFRQYYDNNMIKHSLFYSKEAGQMSFASYLGRCYGD